jgi:hypothetical protein
MWAEVSPNSRPRPMAAAAIAASPTTPATIRDHWRLRSDRKVDPADSPTV